MANREFLQLAHVFEPAKHNIAGWFWSEKLDGMRAWWDGGITRGLPAAEVPWANVEKHGRFLNQVIATGLWSRYGQVIRAPEWWLDFMPKAPFDGELYAGRGKFQYVSSVVKDHHGGEGWNNIHFTAFGMPSYNQVLESGKINNTNFKKQITRECIIFAEKRLGHTVGAPTSSLGFYVPGDSRMFQDTYTIMKRRFDIHNHAFTIHIQQQLPFSQEAALKDIDEVVESITECGGEGIILQKPEACWNPSRMWGCLKVKKLQDSEATVIGYTTGRLTDKGSKLLGMMGALKVEWQGKEFELSGFTDAERELRVVNGHEVHPAFLWATDNPETECQDWIEATHFPRGSKITFKYRELTNDGIPKEARFFRKKEDE